MLRNYILIAFRSLFKNKVYAFINIFGLAIGIACCIYIYLFVQDELSYDKFQVKYDRIYRVLYHATNGKDYAHVPPVISPLLTEYFPEVEMSARMYERNMSVQIDRDSKQQEYEEEDVDLDEFVDEIDNWIIDELKRIGLDTAKSVLALASEDILVLILLKEILKKCSGNLILLY